MKINGDPPPRPNKKGGAAGLFMFAPFTTRSEQLVPSRCKMFTVLFLMCCTKMVLLFLWQYRSSNVHANKSPLNSNKLKNNAWLQQATTHHHLM